MTVAVGLLVAVALRDGSAPADVPLPAAAGPGAAEALVDPAAGTAPGPSGSPSGAPSGSPSPSPSAKPSVSAPPSSQAPVPAPPVSSAPAASPTAAAAAKRSADLGQQVLDLVNVQRAQAGCPAMRSNAKLAAAAQEQSDDMAARSFFDHTNPDGDGPQQRIDAAGYEWSGWGENIARGQKDAAAVMNSWMNSPGHRANILNCKFTELGVGVHQGSGGPWWTQDFGTPG
ncbi:CAP domain-containing protein [Kitasatospora cheerisanensis]|uniref:SCP domain-containing protein n=1 Tax=Kitasatospora cheerisanensis KCTC 2395 TaxID=1348663 RepID=A0A066ZAE4_9ACTN|nr:hypothetical protein KCH_09880 [Kitasatospora cheerisanensis KCTC 2395]